MFSSALWLSGPVLESVLLIRAVQGNFLKQYKVFYSYLSWVLLRDLSLILIYYVWPTVYRYAYWYTLFVSILLGCGVVWEVYKVALSRYPGAARMARNVLLFLFLITMARIFVNAWNSPNWLPARTSLESERDLRVVQAALLLGLAALLAYYAIPMGRNLKGMILGYGVFLGTSLIHLSLRNSLGDSFQLWWQYIQPLAYLLVLLTWCATLWSYAPSPEPRTCPHIEADYQSLATATRKQLIAARSSLLRATRP